LVTPLMVIEFVTVRWVPPLAYWSAAKGDGALLLPQSMRYLAVGVAALTVTLALPLMPPLLAVTV